MTDETAAFGARLYACRQSAGLSQQELAERSGLSIRTISNLEHGRTRWPYPESVHRLADALDLRDGTRGDFIAAAGRRLIHAAADSVTRAPEDRLPRAGREPIVPRQLPASVRQFVGRAEELRVLTGRLDGAGALGPETLVMSAIGGTAGVGKTALAVRWAHQVADRFPDGQLYVNLRGYDPGEPVPAADALAGFLRALGVPGGGYPGGGGGTGGPVPQPAGRAADIPAEAEERAARYRSLLAGRRMLVVLDNAARVEQVRPLLPGSQGCVTVVPAAGAGGVPGGR
jgi:transcriptional regulator with XRE-family HTH domain